MEADDAQECISVSPDVIKRDFDYNLNPSLYLHNNVEIHEGQCLVRLSDVLSLQRPSKNVGSNIELIPVNRFSNEFTKIIFADGKPSEAETISHPNAYKTYHSIVGEKYLLVFNLCTSYASKFALYAGYKDFMCSWNIKVFKINEEIMSSEYLVYNLTNNPLFNKSGLQNYMNMPFVIEKDRERQDAIVERKKQEYREKRRIELQNEEKRLGIKTEISDLEHFIGSQQLKIMTAIARIENIAPDTDKYHENVKLLIDNVKYVFRAIKFFRSDISDEELHNGMAEDDICNFISNYIESWNRYSGNFFNLYVNNELDSTPVMEFNRPLLTVMFDTILDNAGRHSFNKTLRPDNQVEINLSLTEYDNKDNPPWESHLKYVDVQIIFEGAEDFIIANTSTLKPKSYDEASDYHDWEGEGTVRLTLSQGEILILLPYDAHRVGLPPKSGKNHVKKAIVKVPYKG